jgi:hypothetical protein
MSSILDQVLDQLGGDKMKSLSGMLGADPEQTQSATGAAVTALLGGLSRNASSTEGAQALSNALAKDHDGSILDSLQSGLGGLKEGSGDGILRHILGSKRGRVESGVSQASGLNKDATSQLLAMIAPVVLGVLSKQQKQHGADANGLAGMLTGERQQLEKKDPGVAGIVGRLLDTDGDGDMDLSDALQHGKGLLGKFLGG